MPPRFAAFLAVVFWGISFVATKIVLRELSPISLIFTRFGLGVLLLLAILKFRRESPVPPADSIGPLFVMGFFGIFVHQMLQAYGLTLTSAVHTGWLIGLTPIWSAVLAALFLNERFRGLKIAGLVLGFAGALLVVTRGEFSAGALTLPSTRGDALILASTLNWAVYTILGLPTLRRLGPTRATAGAMTFGWLMLVPFFLYVRGWNDYAHLTPKGIGALFFLGFGCSGLGYLFWYGALERIDASRVASFLYIEPLVTLCAAMIILGETASLTTILGGALVIAGVVLVQRR